MFLVRDNVVSVLDYPKYLVKFTGENFRSVLHFFGGEKMIKGWIQIYQ